LQIQVLNASTCREIEGAFATLERARPDALFVGSDAFFTGRRVQLVNLSSHQHSVPSDEYLGRREEVARSGG